MFVVIIEFCMSVINVIHTFELNFDNFLSVSGCKPQEECLSENVNKTTIVRCVVLQQYNSRFRLNLMNVPLRKDFDGGRVCVRVSQQGKKVNFNWGTGEKRQNILANFRTCMKQFWGSQDLSISIQRFTFELSSYTVNGLSSVVSVV